ncbi:alkaline phosphatase D family protein [Desertimonas flava]|uniref:alkaline phosphatase D family protein n=1 Tax=Desertimonas flava TaxID=2064846 RepID=UPI000E354130|nr:alkaline phosphatase D family protein [Desertimonas flava]
MFDHGVASFDPTADGVLLWTRTAVSGPVSWTVATDVGMGDADVVASGDVDPRDDVGTVVVDVGGLKAATTYFYAFATGGVRSPVGRTRTLPDGPVGQFRLAAACCAKYADTPLGVYRAIADDDVDLVVHLGDYVYDTDAPRGHADEATTAVSLEEYDRRYATVRSDPDCMALHQRHPVVAVWDDGDLADLAATGGAPGHDPAKHGPWDARVRAALTARARWLPSRWFDPERPSPTWGSVVVDDLAELLLLDTRVAGRDRQAGEPGTRELHDPARSLLGDEQRRWLNDRLASRSVQWAIPVSSVVVNEIVLPLPAPSGVNSRLPPGYAYLDGKVMHDDQWDGYPAERDNLARRLRTRHEAGRSALLLSGDVHASWAFEGPMDPDGDDATAVEFTVPAVSSPTMEQTVVPRARGLGRVVRRAVQQLPHVRHADLVHHGYGVLTLTPERATMTWWHVDPYADDPIVDRAVGAVLAVNADAWPPTLHAATDTAGSDRPPVPRNPVPPRPSDLPALRRGRHRRALAWSGLGALVSLAVYAVGRGWRR